MFGKQTAERFEKEQPSEVGPGSYDLASTLEGKGGIMEGRERWQEDSPGGQCESPRKNVSESVPLAPTPARNVAAEKGNRSVSMQKSSSKKELVRSASPRVPAAPASLTTPAAAKTSRPSLPSTPTGVAPANSAVDAEARQRHRDLRLASQLDLVRDELKQKAKETKELQNSVTSKDRKIEELQKKIEELAADRREAHRRTAESENERDLKRRQLHEKEQDLLAMQRKHERMRLAQEERNKHADRKGEEHRAAQADMQRLKANLEALQEQLAASERDRRSAEQSQRHSQQCSAELESGLKSHIDVLEEQLRCEAARRQELEDRWARNSSEREQGETEIADLRRRNQELQSSLSQLQADVKTKLSAERQRAERHGELEDEVRALRAETQVQKESLQRAEIAREELGKQVVRAEAALEANSQELSAAQARNVELEDEQQRFGKSQYVLLQEKLDAAEKQAKELNQDVADERARIEAFERQVAALSEKERAAQLQVEQERAARMRDSTYCELEARALLAEQEAEEARQNCERWKEWGDEQQLRELSLESEHLEKLKQVRQDVERHFEKARLGLVDENRALQQRISELENGSTATGPAQAELAERDRQLADQASSLAQSSMQQAQLEAELKLARHTLETASEKYKEQRRGLEDQITGLDKKCRQLEARATEAEKDAARAKADAEVAADEFADDRQRFEEERKDLQAKQVEAIRQRDQELQSCSQANQSRVQELDKDIATARSRAVHLRWQLLSEAQARQANAAAQEESWTRLRQLAVHWRSAAADSGRDAERLARDDHELARLDEENQHLCMQNKEILLSLQAHQQDLQFSLAENKRLSERENAYENDMRKLGDRNAELAGHNNHKQKIKHVAALKEDNDKMRQQLKSANQRAALLQSQLRAANFFEATKPTDPDSSKHTPSTPGQRHTGCQQPTQEGTEQLRHARAHRRASERAVNEYEHLFTLVQRALGVAPGALQMEGAEPKGRDPADSNELYRQLRELSVSVVSTKAAGLSGLTTPAGSGGLAEPEEMASACHEPRSSSHCNDSLPDAADLV